MNSLRKGEPVPLLNFEGGPRVPLLNFEGGPGVPLLNFRGGSRVPPLNFEGVPRSMIPGSRDSGPTFTPCCKTNTKVLFLLFVVKKESLRVVTTAMICGTLDSL